MNRHDEFADSVHIIILFFRAIQLIFVLIALKMFSIFLLKSNCRPIFGSFQSSVFFSEYDD
jgi:hypothetical protein